MPQFQLSSLFSDKAVLCRNKEIRVFGIAEDGLSISVSLFNSSGILMARDTAEAKSGRFIALLPPQESAVECRLLITDGQTEIIISDIAIGDVYLAGGQSNMELELKDADGGVSAVASHQNSYVRYYNIPRCAVNGPETDMANKQAHWQEIRPGAGKDMSAVAYFFAMRLQKEISVPVGIIDCYWGGSSISCWMTQETLESTAEGHRYLVEYAQKVGQKTMKEYLEEEKVFLQSTQNWDRKAEQARKYKPGITIQELNQLLGPYPWFPPDGPGSPFRPAGLSDTMLRRVEPFALTGVLFYQGEADIDRTEHYDVLLQSFIYQLRMQFRDWNLPFLNVQLPMWIEAGKPDSRNWPKLRLAQDKVNRITRGSDLVVLIDQGEYDNIHPTNKKVVGERLFLSALRTVYNIDAPAYPEAINKYTDNGSLYIILSQPVYDCGSSKTLLEIAGEDEVFYDAEAEIKNSTLRLSNPLVPRPVQARYAWWDFARVTYFGKNGLPLAPFMLE